MNRAKSICRKPGCNKLIDKPGYCPDHQINPADRFKPLDNKKTPEQRAFYSSTSWTHTSKSFRAKNPLCNRCRAAGKVVAGVLVHHNPPLEELLRDGLNPLSEEHLETLCHNCHQKDLYLKRESPKRA